ncbi:hypothetical protein QQF64_031523 [Cirrhinus molitorella]|uniref:Chromo domain-containing protein n=1 Tax=Cirrhinus molitorella TaxID=172907 RepID=A0ABR3MX97_9TELE
MEALAQVLPGRLNATSHRTIRSSQSLTDSDIPLHPPTTTRLAMSTGEPGHEEEPPPPLMLEEGSIYAVKEILRSRRRGGQLEYLVDWEGYGPEERSWVSRSDILDPTLMEEFHSNHPEFPAPRGRETNSDIPSILPTTTRLALSTAGLALSTGVGSSPAFVSAVLARNPLRKSFSGQIALSIVSMTNNSDLELLSDLTELIPAYVENLISGSFLHSPLGKSFSGQIAPSSVSMTSNSKSFSGQIAPSSVSMTNNSELELLSGLTELIPAYVENLISGSEKGVLCNGKRNSKSFSGQIAPSSVSMTNNSDLELLSGLTELIPAYVENLISGQEFQWSDRSVQRLYD